MIGLAETRKRPGRQRKIFPFARVLAVGLLALALDGGRAARAQDPTVAQYIGMTNQVLDEYGQPLRGNDPQAGAYGVAAVEEGALVEIFHALDNTIHPPSTNGVPHANNKLVHSTRIGRGVSPTLATPGNFAAALTPRPGGNSRIFARVYNRPTVSASSFYGDSQLFIVQSFRNPVFVPNIQKTDKPLDPNDSDKDGLSNSWEKSLGSNPDAPDTDGDGFSDREEQIAGTDLLDAESLLQIVTVQPAGGDDARLTWSSAAGVKYRVEYTATPLHQSPAYSVVTNVTANGPATEVVVEGGLADEGRSYRVWAVAP
jgi:hypothetical protein